MKKLVLCLTVGVFLVSLFACGGGGKYAEVKDVLGKSADATEKFVAAAEKVANADDAAAALNGYAEAMAELAPKMGELANKFPEIKNKEELPAEIKAEVERFIAAMGKFGGVMMKFAPYMSDPKVMEAQKKVSEAMAAMK